MQKSSRKISSTKKYVVFKKTFNISLQSMAKETVFEVEEGNLKIQCGQ